MRVDKGTNRTYSRDYEVEFYDSIYLVLRVTAFIRVRTPSVVMELSLRSSILRSMECSTRTESVYIERGGGKLLVYIYIEKNKSRIYTGRFS